MFAGFKSPMNHQIRMRMAAPQQHLPEQHHPLAHRQPALVAEQRDRLAPTYSSAQQAWPSCHAGIEQAGDVWMRHGRRGVALASKRTAKVSRPASDRAA